MIRLPSKTRCIGILTSGGDCPGLNAAIRGVAKPCINEYGIKVIGILDGFRGLVENRIMVLDDQSVSGILTHGGTILGTSRDKPHKMPVGGKVRDMTDVVVHNYHELHLDCLVCLGGGGTQKNALYLHEQGGIDVLTLPKTIDNDVAETDVTFGFDTAMEIVAEAIDRLHTTATSHHRIIICETMGHNAGWLPLGAGIASGADVILIPEIPYDLGVVAEHLRERRRSGKRFSIIVVAEGARPATEAAAEKARRHKRDKKRDEGEPEEPQSIGDSKAAVLARSLQALTGAEARVTSLGHVQRGGWPAATDRLLCTRLGVAAAECLAKGHYNVMIAVRADKCVAVPLKDVAGKRKVIPPDHPWIKAARLVGTCLGDA
jgi:6-phosphofructokinase 1